MGAPLGQCSLSAERSRLPSLRQEKLGVTTSDVIQFLLRKSVPGIFKPSITWGISAEIESQYLANSVVIRAIVDRPSPQRAARLGRRKYKDECRNTKPKS